MKPLLALVLVAAGLPGCLSEQPNAMPSVAPDGADAVLQPEDLDVLDILPLDSALAGELYTVDLAPGWTSASITFSRVGHYTDDQYQNSPLCIDYTTPTTEGRAGDRCPSPGNIQVQVEGPLRMGPEVLVSWTGEQLAAGHYEFRIHSDPQLNDLRIKIDVDYP